MINFPYIRIFPQKMSGTKCDYCNEQHGIRYWMHTNLPGLRFISKKCMNSYIREHNKPIKVKKVSNKVIPEIKNYSRKVGQNQKDFETQIYPQILERLSKSTIFYTKSTNKPNWVEIENDTVLVMTERSRPDYKTIPFDLFKKTWNLIVSQGEITQYELSKVHYIKRSAFMIIAFDLLDEVRWQKNRNSLKLI